MDIDATKPFFAVSDNARLCFDMIFYEKRITKVQIRSAQAGLWLCCSQRPLPPPQKKGFLASRPNLLYIINGISNLGHMIKVTLKRQQKSFKMCKIV